MAVMIEVWGDYACFTRPELKTERVSYDVITPSAARGILDSVYWHPGMLWVIDNIWVCNPIRFANIRRNETKSKISGRNAKTAMMRGTTAGLELSSTADRQQRATLLLTDVRYVIEAHFELIPEKMGSEDSADKFQAIVMRRLSKGQCYHQPCFGCREFPAHFQLCEQIPPCPEELKGQHDFGFMLYDMDFSDAESFKPLLFRARMQDGRIAVPPRYSEEVLG
ncbi:MAG: type I-C CRISPR-associated protein Cas5c [bacterium]|nr:type I-C CRISPR-associated protein Cas5c [bacterium]